MKPYPCCRYSHGTIAGVQEIMRSLDPQLPFYEIKTLAEEVQSSLWSERLVAALASGSLAGIVSFGLLPVSPLLLTMVSLEELLKRLLQVVF